MTEQHSTAGHTPAAKTYTSQVDLWLLLVLLACMTAVVYSGYHLVRNGGGLSHWLISLFNLALGAGLPLWLLLGTRYTLTREQLLVRSAFLRWQIPLADITQVSASRSLASGPALSLNRLAIRYGRYREILVSPKHRREFLQHLDELGVKGVERV